MSLHLTPSGKMRRNEEVPLEQISQDRLWRKRPDGIAFKMTTKTKVGVDGIQADARSDVTNQHVVRSKRVLTDQYQSFRSALSKTIQRSGWMVEQISFITGLWSLNEKDLKENLEYFKVSHVSIELIRSELAMKLFDEYANILKGMYCIRFNRRSDHRWGHPNPPTSGPHVSPY